MRHFVFLISLLSILSVSQATHLVGGEIAYECMGDDEYLITLKVYRDCGPTNTNNTQFDNLAPIGIYTSTGTLAQTIAIPFPGATQLDVVISNPCLQSPPSICIEEVIYTSVVTLPPIPGGYNIVYQRCCRNPSTQNIMSPATFGSSYFVSIPDTAIAACNNSAFFTNAPPLALCANDPFVFDHSATDTDGDSLSYEFCTPYQGGSPNNPSPSPPQAPPFALVPWLGGFSGTNPMPANPQMTIDPVTGVITGTPTSIGIYAVAICVKEWRNGVLINENKRDFQFTVTNCQSNVVAGIPSQISTGSGAQFCSGTTVTLMNSSVNASSYFWDFGDPNTLADTSNLMTPTWTYSDTGTYTITLIANPGWPCADTTFTTYEMYPSVTTFFERPEGQCLQGNSFSLLAEGSFGQSATFLWDFGPNATPSTSTAINPVVSFSDTGRYVVTLTSTEHDCSDTYQDTIFVFPPPTVNFELPPESGCVPLTVNFDDNSFAWTNISYRWNFGDGDTSSLANPTHVYNAVGDYEVVLTISTDSGCVGTAVSNAASIKVNPRPRADFSVFPLATSIFQPDITVTDASTGNTGVTYYLQDGNVVENEVQFTHAYQDTGHYNIAAVAVNQYDCYDTARVQVWIQPEFLLYAPNAFTPNGDGVNDFFRVVVGGADRYELLIFNRWGQVIFESGDPANMWDGRMNNGELAPIGTYVYKASLRNINTKFPFQKVGHVTIVR